MQSASTGSVKTGVQPFGAGAINVSEKERAVSVLLGAYILSRGIKKLSLIKTVLGGYLLYRGASGHCAAREAIQRSQYTDKAESVNIKTSFIVNKPRQEVYDFWRKLENLPLFMKHLATVTQYDETRSHWEAKIPGNLVTLEWDAEIVKETDGSLLAWKSLPGATVENAGKVEFKDALGTKGTELDVMITYRPPAGKIGGGVASVLNPVFKKMIESDVKNFKQYIETGRLTEAV